MSSHILTAEDDVDFQETLTLGLRAKGFETFAANNGKDALKILSKEPIDVVISDIRMPDMDGVQLLEKIRKNESDRKIKTPVLLMSGYSDYGAVVKALHLGASDYLAKPFDMDEFFHTLNLHLQLRQLQMERESYNQRLEEAVRERTKDLLDANYKLKRLAEIKDTFVGMVSHELRNPLQLIRGHADLLLSARRPPTPEETRDRLTTVISESDRLSRLITDLLKVESFESGRIPLRLSPCDFAALTEGVVARFKSTHPQAPIRLKRPDRPVTADADAEKLTEVLINLIDNAIKYTPAERGVDVQLDDQDGTVMVRVSDHGEGISEEDQERIFESFYRIPAKDKKIRGFGLGLTICRSILQAHQGKIWVESKPGFGSSFIFRLPKTQSGEMLSV